MTDPVPSRVSRSPRYPGYPIQWAIEKGTKLLDSERLHPVPPDIVAQALNYKDSNSGAASRAIASLKAFGILQRSANGWLQVNPDVQRYKLTPNKDDKVSYLTQWLKSPLLYSKLLDKHGMSLPSDKILVFELVAEHGFTEGAAQQAVRVLKESVSYVENTAGILDAARRETPETIEIEAEQKEQLRLDWESLEKVGQELKQHSRYSTCSPATSDGLSYPVRLPGGRLAQIVVPGRFYKADKARLQAQLTVIGTDDEDDNVAELQV